MPCFRCEKCGCIENTALGNWWCKDAEWNKGTEFSKALCSECMPTVYPDGSKTKGGKWHGRFPKEQATEEHRGKLLNW
jgi:hypothetical protein